MLLTISLPEHGTLVSVTGAGSASPTVVVRQIERVPVNDTTSPREEVGREARLDAADAIEVLDLLVRKRQIEAAQVVPHLGEGAGTDDRDDDSSQLLADPGDGDL